MPVSDSTRTKPDKPSPDFPLTASGNGQWIRRFNGKVYCFGVWADPAATLAVSPSAIVIFWILKFTGQPLSA